jgi:uncharacterized LabA/DUF88 family protein
MTDRPNIYIDGNNLHRSALDLGFEIDYKKFYGWLRQKYQADNIYIFLGFIKENENFYKNLKNVGYTVVFKDTVSYLKIIKGNCDTELTVTLLVDLYEKNIDNFTLITNDGDFSFLVKLLIYKNKKVKLCSPNLNKCSTLLKKIGLKIDDFYPHYKKFSK